MENFKNSLYDSLKIFFKEWKIFFVFSIPVLLVLIYIDLQNINIGFLQLHSIDEYVFHGSLRSMYLGLINYKFSSLFGYGFYQYGFIYFFINLLIVIPAFLLKNTAVAIFLPRLIVSLFAVSSLVVIYKISRLYLSRSISFLFVLLFITMPAFWFNATWFHPDWSITFFLLMYVLYLIKDNWNFGKNFYVAVFFYAIAVAFKYQAITVLPLLLVYIFYENIKNFNFLDLKKRIVLFIGSLISILVVFFFSNPYIAHPMGWIVFSSAFVGNMKSNATNHGIAYVVTFWDKVTLAIGDYYINWIFLLMLLGIALWPVWLFFKEKDENIFSVIAINFLINIAYLLLFVNKAWQIYYLPVITMGFLILIYVIRKLNEKRGIIILLFILLIQLISYSGQYSSLLTMSRDANNPDSNDYTLLQNNEMNDFILKNLKSKVSDNSVILISPYTPFEYEKIGIEYEKVRVIFGSLSQGSIDLETYVKSQRAYWGSLKTDKELAKSFKKVNFIVLRKNIPFIDIKRIDKSSEKESYLKAVEIVKKLDDGSLGYTKLAENELVVIYENKQ